MHWTILTSDLDTLVLILPHVSASALLDSIWMFLFGSLVMGLLAVASTVIQRQRSYWLHNAREQSPRLIAVETTVLASIKPVEEAPVPSPAFAA